MCSNNDSYLLQVEVDKSYLPSAKMSAYKKKEGGLQLRTLIPARKNPEEFIRNLGKRFKNVCFSEIFVYI